MSLAADELLYLESKINRKPTITELEIVAAQWSEHCSYKSSKIHLRKLPMSGPLVIKEKGYDSGVLDVGDGYVVTVHIESHNHPSAVEPYGGAATGVGGVIRDILSAGTRPIAILDSLRFGNIKKDAQARWLFKNAVTGIADYGNCLGIPTIGGEVEFDNSFANYALVDVAAIGFGKKDKLIKNHANIGDAVVLLGGPTGKDGVGGAQFASDSLESKDRSAVQIPDPFIEKLIIETILEARDKKLIHAMKDLGGGGLACAVSETADSLSIGIEMNVKNVHTRESDMNPQEIMISESQERMLIITSSKKVKQLGEICQKYHIPYSVIGTVKSNKIMHVKDGQKTLACLPTNVVANAQLLKRKSTKPKYLEKIKNDSHIKMPSDLATVLQIMLSSPNIASKQWVYSQYDHEVGIRTVIKPGHDGSVLRLDNGKYLAVKIDANPKHCYLNPRAGAVGCFEEACRNVICTGAKPIGMVDHLQFGNPENPEIFWTFLESLHGISEYAKYCKIPCVGGKVSFYNETENGPIKPTPLIGVLGLIEKKPLMPQQIVNEDVLIILGETHDELGGSEYLEHVCKFTGGVVADVNYDTSKTHMNMILELIGKNLVKVVHDCSKGGIAIALSELCITNEIGCSIKTQQIPSEKISLDRVLFSESHSRYLIVAKKSNVNAIKKTLGNAKYGVIGTFAGKYIIFGKNNTKLNVDKAKDIWSKSLRSMI